MEVNIKQELKNLDRTNLCDVNDLVQKIIADLIDILITTDSEVMLGAVSDYMIDLINPDLLDFDSTDS